MASNDYEFVTRWTFEATCEQVYQILNKPLDLTRWWPEVYLQVTQTAHADANGVGAEFALHTKGFLPYTLKWSFRTTKVAAPHSLGIEASGDFDGEGVNGPSRKTDRRPTSSTSGPSGRRSRS